MVWFSLRVREVPGSIPGAAPPASLEFLGRWELRGLIGLQTFICQSFQYHLHVVSSFHLPLDAALLFTFACKFCPIMFRVESCSFRSCFPSFPHSCHVVFLLSWHCCAVVFKWFPTVSHHARFGLLWLFPECLHNILRLVTITWYFCESYGSFVSWHFPTNFMWFSCSDAVQFCVPFVFHIIVQCDFC